MEKDKHLGLRIDSETHGKLKSLAEFEGRSINGEVLYLCHTYHNLGSTPTRAAMVIQYTAQ